MAESLTVDDTQRRLEDALERGVFLPGRRLPSERKLSEDFGVSRTTLRKALIRLADSGTVTPSAQRGWFVSRTPSMEPPSSLQTFTEMARERGLEATATILEQIVRPATLEEAERLRIAPAEDVLHVKRLRGMGGKNLCLDNSSMPASRVEPLISADLTNQSLYERLETLCGVTIYRSAYSVEAYAAEVELAEILEIDVGSPVLIGREVSFSRQGEPIIVGVNYHRGDAYRFEADLFRRQG